MTVLALYPGLGDRYAVDVRIALDALSNDPALLHELVRDLAATLENRDAAIVSKDVALAEGVAEVERSTDTGQAAPSRSAAGPPAAP